MARRVVQKVIVEEGKVEAGLPYKWSAFMASAGVMLSLVIFCLFLQAGKEKFLLIMIAFIFLVFVSFMIYCLTRWNDLMVSFSFTCEGLFYRGRNRDLKVSWEDISEVQFLKMDGRQHNAIRIYYGKGKSIRLSSSGAKDTEVADALRSLSGSSSKITVVK